jgi:chromosome segregation ATPase
VTTEQRLDNIDSRLAALLAVAETQQGDITALTENIAAVNHQTELLVSGLGQLLEGITEFRADMAELKELTQQQGDRISQLKTAYVKRQYIPIWSSALKLRCS